MSLPGSISMLKDSDKNTCDDHPERHAVARLCTESDSFGDEYSFMCKECYEEYKKDADEDIIDTCEWCKTENVAVRPIRDIDEGSHGPVYYVCSKCAQDYRKRMEEELDSF